MTEDRSNFITVTQGSLWFAVMYWWNKEYNGFWEPWDTGYGRYATKEEAIVEAKEWAEDIGVRYVEAE